MVQTLIHLLNLKVMQVLFQYLRYVFEIYSASSIRSAILGKSRKENAVLSVSEKEL